ncbi:MAG TPA: S8 family serine peptidase [Candidatus Elarobacter sp.]|jgi:hypothetical protein
MRNNRSFLTAVGMAAAVLAAGCSGGGGSTSGVITTPSTPAPTATPSADTCLSASRANAAGARGAAPAALSSWIVPDRLYVTSHANAATRTAQHLERIAGISSAADLGTANAMTNRVVTVRPDANAASVAAALRALPDVVDVAPVHRRRVSDANDPRLNNVDQWYLYKTNTDPGAWALTHGSAAVSIAVIDTGVDETNADLATKIDVRERIVHGVKTTGAGSVQDTNGHGTNVAGLAAAATNNTTGFAGAGYDVHLQIYKIFPDATAQGDCQSADTADEAQAITDAVANGASVINLSLGGPQSAGLDQAERNAVEFAIAQGVTVVAAAGNDFPSADGAVPEFPAADPGVIAVGASSVRDSAPNQYTAITAELPASYSNSGATVLAPGGDPQAVTDTDRLHWIEGYSTTTAAYAPDRCTVVAGVCATLFAGTSQATPQAAAAAALMMSYHGGPRSLTPATVLQLLTTTADVLPAAGTDRQGAGRINVARAVSAAHP